MSPLDPWLAMAAAVHRSGDARGPWNPAEALTARQALAASTDGRGTLAVGHPGDLVLLDADPTAGLGDSAAVARHLRSVRVAATLLGGRPAHQVPPEAPGEAVQDGVVIDRAAGTMTRLVPMPRSLS